jgi:predicted dehydrogenase
VFADADQVGVGVHAKTVGAEALLHPADQRPIVAGGDHGCKPFAASLAEADAMLAVTKPTGKLLAINWPLAWVPSHVTAKRLIDERVIGDVIEVHYYDGNRGPLWHVAGKKETTAETVAREKAHSWFYKKEHGGGSLLDYLGYGTTLGTWFLNGRVPLEVTSVIDSPRGLEVDEHSVTIARYEFGLSKFESRWGTFTDPWTHQPQPQCGMIHAYSFPTHSPSRRHASEALSLAFGRGLLTAPS